METCTPYLECTNKNESWESLFKRLIVEQPDGSLTVRTCCADAVVPPVELALILEWDDIANVPLCDYSDAPAPGNITITPDAVGDNPVTWYYTACYTGAENTERSLFSTESSFIIGDATTEIIFNSDDMPSWCVAIIVFFSQTSGNYEALTAAGILPFDFYGAFMPVPLGTFDVYSATPIHQDCTHGDPTDVDNWNTFFDLPTNGTPFTSVTVAGNSVYLYGGGNMTLTNGEMGYACGNIGGNPQLFEGNAHIVGIDDQAGVIVAVADECFFGMELSGENCIPVSILEYFNSNSCTTVGNAAFYGCTSLTSMAAGITTVGAAAFNGCTSLTSMAAGITTVGNGAFYGCTSLTSMAAGITTVGAAAFNGCTSLTSMAAGITTVGNGAFVDCTSLTSMAAGITTVGNQAFASCTSLTSMADGITTVGDYAFTGCTSLTSMAAGITTVGKGAFYGCTSLTSMAAGITTVGDEAFVDCTSLTSMLIPLCTTLGTDCTDNSVFVSITGLTITVTCDASLLTCNAGAPDGDLCTLAANNTITVNGAPLAGCP